MVTFPDVILGLLEKVLPFTDRQSEQKDRAKMLCAILVEARADIADKQRKSLSDKLIEFKALTPDQSIIAFLQLTSLKVLSAE